MKRFVLAVALMMPAACATTATPDIQLAERTAPVETVRVMVGGTSIPVAISTIPLHTELREPESPAREHIRQMLLNAAI